MMEEDEGEEEKACGGAVVTTGVIAGVGGFEFAGEGGWTTHILCNHHH